MAKHILLIKFSKALRNLLTAQLQNAGYHVSAPDRLLTALEEMIAARQDNSIDLIITGLRMADQPDGKDLLRAVYEQAGLAKVVISTGSEVPEEYRGRIIIYESPLNIGSWLYTIKEILPLE